MFQQSLSYHTHKTPILQATLSISLTLFVIFLKIPIFFLHGLHTYIQPDNVSNSNGVKAAIRRPSSDSASGGGVLKKRIKSKEKFEFDESNAQIFRLKLDESHLRSRLFFNDYWYSFVLCFMSLSWLLGFKVLNFGENHGVSGSGYLIAVGLGSVCVFKLLVSLAKVSFEKSASKRSEKQLSVLLGIGGFLVGVLIWSGIARSVLDFDFGSVDGFLMVCLAILMGCLSGFLYMPACKNARAFWLGTDQIRSDLEIISCGWFARGILYVNYLVLFFAACLWVRPLAEILIYKNVDGKGRSYVGGGHKIGGAEKLLGNVGFVQSDFEKLRLGCLLLSGLVQIVALRPNLQMYLNESVLSWYQRLHSSKIPDLDYSRAKVFLHNHYLCLAVLQFFSPPLLVLLFLGLSQVNGNSIENFNYLCGLVPCLDFYKEATLFLAWWVVFIWTAFTTTSLFLYRHGTLYVS